MSEAEEPEVEEPEAEEPEAKRERNWKQLVTMTLTLLQSVHSMAPVSSEEGWNCWMVQNNNLITEIADEQKSFNVGPTTN
jgi:hypothetical protein